VASELTGSKTCWDVDAEASVLGKENSSLSDDIRSTSVRVRGNEKRR
jgi:hypothetical protein